MEGDAADELDVEMDHLPFHRVVVDENLAATEAAGTIFHHGVGLGEDFFEVKGAGFPEVWLDVMEGSLRGFDRFCGGEDGGGQRGEFLAQRSKTGFKKCYHLAQLGVFHPLDQRSRRNLKRMVAGEVRFPFRGEFQELLDWLALEGLLDFIDASHRRADAAHFALVFAADDFLENPLDHIGRSRAGKSTGRRGIHQHFNRCKPCGGLEARSKMGAVNPGVWRSDRHRLEAAVHDHFHAGDEGAGSGGGEE